MLIAVFAITFVAAHVAAEIPPYIHVCGRRNPNLDECILKSVADLKEKLCEGIPELDVPSNKDMFIEKLYLSNSSNTKIMLENVLMNGLCDYKINSIHMDLENNHFDVDITFNQIQINSTYYVNLRILVPFSSSAAMFISTDNVNVKTGLDMKTVVKGGKTHMYISRMKTNIDIKDYNALYDLDENINVNELRQAVANFLGNNQQEIIASIKPFIEDVISKQILSMSNNIIKHFTYDELFPDRT